MSNQENRFSEIVLVGKGAFGEVFGAHDKVLNRRVAIKKYYKQTSELGAILKSVANWSKLNHPNIAQILDYRDQDGQFSLTMTFCSNGQITELLQKSSRNHDQLIGDFCQIGNAVSYIHSKNLVHRDLKLSNIMIDEADNPVLIDLDLCIDTDSLENRNQVGTLSYMAPELFQEDGKCSFHSDQFALGVILFELISGTLVDEGLRHRNNRQTNLSYLPELNSTTAQYKDWNAIISKATRSDPMQRYCSVAELVADVESVRDRKPISVRPISRGERAIRWAQGNPLTATLISMLFGTTLVGLALGLYLWNQTTAARISIEINTQELNQRIKEAEASKSELAALVSTVKFELAQAEHSESEQRQATDTAQANRANLQQQAERSQKLTAELNDLLAKAQASTDSVKLAEQNRTQVQDQLAKELKNIADKEYSTKVSQIWASISDQKWKQAKLDLDLLPKHDHGLEYEILQRAIKNQLSRPVKIELGQTPNRYAQGALSRLKPGTPQLFRLDKSPMRMKFQLWERALIPARLEVDLLLPENGKLGFEIGPQHDDEKLLALLQDGSILVAVGARLSVWTFSPKEYAPSSQRMSLEMEHKLKKSLVALDLASGDNATPQTEVPKQVDVAREPINHDNATPQTEVPKQVDVAREPSNRDDATKSPETQESTKAKTELVPAELQAGEYFSSISAKIGLNDNKKHIVSLEYSSRDAISTQHFSAISELSLLKHANLAFSQVDDECLASLAKCSRLEHLNFWSAPRITDAGLRNLRDLPVLTFLNIGYTQATLDAIDYRLLENLQVLYLNNTSLGTTRLSRLCLCQKLKTVSVYSMKIEDDDLEVFKELPSLENLDLGPVAITDRGLDIIGQISTLKRLDLKGTPVSDSRVEEFRKLHPQCKVLR